MISTVDIAVQTDSPSTSATNQVHTGSAIKAIFLKVEAVGAVASANIPRVYFYILKNPANEINVTNMAPDEVGSNARRKFVIHQEMMMMSQQASSAGGGDFTFPRTMFKGVVRLPKRYQRFGVDDRLQLVLANFNGETSGTTRICMQSIYKEFF